MISKGIFNMRRGEDFDSEGSETDNREKKLTPKEEEGEEIMEVEDINKPGSVIENLAKKMLMAVKINTNSDTMFKLKNFLVERTLQELKQIKQYFWEFFPGIHNFILANREDGKLYNLFKAYHDLLVEVRNNEKLKSVLQYSEKVLDENVELMDEFMSDIILTQEKSKKTRKNLKEKLRLQRRLTEAREKFKEIESPIDDNVKPEK